MGRASVQAVTTFLLARHGETDWNRQRRFQGVADPPLNDDGREQARRLAATLSETELAAIYSSDLRRAYETAVIVGEAKQVPVIGLPGLRENDVGSWTGLTVDEARQRFPEQFARWEAGDGFGWTDGETYPEMAARVVRATHEIAGSHPGANVLLITHAGPLRAIRANVLGLDYRASRAAFGGLANCEICRVEVHS